MPRWAIDVCTACGGMGGTCECGADTIVVEVVPAYPGTFRGEMLRHKRRRDGEERRALREARARERRGESIDPPRDPRRDDDVIIRG